MVDVLVTFVSNHPLMVMTGALVAVIAGVVAVTVHEAYQDRLAAEQLTAQYAELQRLRRDAAKLRGDL